MSEEMSLQDRLAAAEREAAGLRRGLNQTRADLDRALANINRKSGVIDDLASLRVDFATLAREYAALREERDQAQDSLQVAYRHINTLQNNEESLRERLNAAYNGGAAHMERVYTADAQRQAVIFKQERDAAQAEAARAIQEKNAVLVTLGRFAEALRELHDEADNVWYGADRSPQAEQDFDAAMRQAWDLLGAARAQAAGGEPG